MVSDHGLDSYLEVRLPGQLQGLHCSDWVVGGDKDLLPRENGVHLEPDGGNVAELGLETNTYLSYCHTLHQSAITLNILLGYIITDYHIGNTEIEPAKAISSSGESKSQKAKVYPGFF